MNSHHPEILTHSETLFDPCTVKDNINILTRFNQKIPVNIQTISESIRLQCLDIYDALKPLEKLGIRFELWLTGGSVRDLLLGHENNINDLDIMLSFVHHTSKRKITGKQFIEMTGINPLDYPGIAWLDKNYNEPPFSHWEKKSDNERSDSDIKIQACYDMSYCLVAQKLKIQSHYIPYLKSKTVSTDAIIEEDYLDNRLRGVLKINMPHWKWKCDLLITQHAPLAFLKAFDFGICKVAVQLYNSSLAIESKESFPLDVKEFFLNIRFDKDFLEDYELKQIRMNAQTVNIGQLKHSFDIHLPKILKKYPWKLVVIEDKTLNSDSEEESHEKSKYINTHIFNNKLNQSLNEKITKIRSQKI